MESAVMSLMAAQPTLPVTQHLPFAGVRPYHQLLSSHPMEGPIHRVDAMERWLALLVRTSFMREKIAEEVDPVEGESLSQRSSGMVAW